jgi:hypothetical protein
MAGSPRTPPRPDKAMGGGQGSQRRPRKAVAGSQGAEAEPDEALGWEEVKALRENQEKLWEEVRELRHDFIVFRTELTGISATVGAIAESGARRALREWAAAQGIRLGRLRSITVEGREINFVAEYVDTEGRKGILYAEAKSTVRSREVEDFSQLASAAEKIYGQGLKVILGFRIYEEAYEAAEKEGITLVEA